MILKNRFLTILIIVVCFFSCSPKLENDHIVVIEEIEEVEDDVEFDYEKIDHSQDALVAFVGGLISCEPKPRLDSIYNSTCIVVYRVVEMISNSNESELIVFEYSNEFGDFEISNFKNKFILLCKRNDTLRFLDSYQAFSTESNEWAVSPFLTNADSTLQKLFTPIDFDPEISHSILNFNEQWIEMRYPKSIYSYSNHQAICEKGIYVNDFFDYLRKNEYDDYFVK